MQKWESSKNVMCSQKSAEGENFILGGFFGKLSTMKKTSFLDIRIA